MTSYGPLILIVVIAAVMALIPTKYGISETTASTKIGVLAMSPRYYVFLALLSYITYAHATM